METAKHKQNNCAGGQNPGRKKVITMAKKIISGKMYNTETEIRKMDLLQLRQVEADLGIAIPGQKSRALPVLLAALGYNVPQATTPAAPAAPRTSKHTIADLEAMGLEELHSLAHARGYSYEDIPRLEWQIRDLLMADMGLAPAPAAVTPEDLERQIAAAHAQLQQYDDEL